MKIALINASPKIKNSNSELILSDLKHYLNGKCEIVETKLSFNADFNSVYSKVKDADSWLFAYPLYVDGIPGHLLSCLMQLEETLLQKQISIYGIVNCGFYEGIQAKHALKLLENWSIKADFAWCGGVGIGGGGGLAMMPQMKPGQGPKAPIDKALAELAESILKGEARENNYVSVAFPRFLYKLGAQMGWRQMIKANGGKTKDLKRKQ